MAQKNMQPIEEVVQQQGYERTCFIITPVGADNSEIRRRADGVIDAVLVPVLKDMKIEPITPHRIANPGSITQQVVMYILNSDLVIANLTGLNPNVMYELAVRHATGKPIVCIAEKGTDLPFDILTERTIFYMNDMKGVEDLKPELRKFIGKSLGQDDFDNPIYRAERMFRMQQAAVSEDKDSIVKYMDARLNTIANKVDVLVSMMKNSSMKSDDETIACNRINHSWFEDYYAKNYILGEPKELFLKK